MMINPVGDKFTLTLNEDVADKKNNTGFASLLQENLDRVNSLQQEADRVSKDFTLGKIDNVHDVTIAAARAQVALNLTLAIQNKIVDAYNEVMRMQI